MAIAPSIVRFLAREAKREPIQGEVLTWGRQHVFADFEGVRGLIQAERLMPQDLAIPARVDGGVVFTLLGAPHVTSLDVSDYEQADEIVDLNQPAPEHLLDRFDFIFDGGTLEHVFDTRQALANAVHMLKPGGRIIHQVPASNFIDHGFFSMSPVLFLDYYHLQGFEDCRLFLMKGIDSSQNLADLDWTFEAYDPAVTFDQSALSGERIMLCFCARKGNRPFQSTAPMQGSAFDHLQRELREASTSELAGELGAACRTIDELQRCWPDSARLRMIRERLDAKQRADTVTVAAFYTSDDRAIHTLLNLDQLSFSQRTLIAAQDNHPDDPWLPKITKLIDAYEPDAQGVARHKPRIFIFGAGGAGQAAFDDLNRWGEVVGFIDNDAHKDGRPLLGVAIHTPAKALAQDFDVIVIASMYAPQITQQLHGLGVEDLAILDVREV